VAGALDLLFRGGAGVLLLLLAFRLMRDFARVTAARAGAAFALGVAALLVCSAPGVHEALGPFAAPVLALAAGNNLVFWLFAGALFDEEFRFRPWHGAAWGLVVALGLAHGFGFGPAELLRRLLALQTLGFSLAAAAMALASWRADLVERRRRLRLFVVLAAAGHTVTSGLAGLIGPGGPALSDPLGTGAILAIAAVVAATLLRVDGASLFPVAAPAGVAPAPAADPAAVAALERAMTVERLYRQEGLTIGRLAQARGMPEYRMRRLINQGLGYRNFTAFLNHYRLGEVKAALADPEQAAVPILTLALDAGFNSLGPFNRAFRVETGMTPSDFRRVALADSRIGQPARRRGG